jgi:hypothetical protein
LRRSQRELHLLERRAPHETVRVTEGLGHFVMVVSFTDYKLHRFARRFDRGDELTRLSLKLRRLESSVTDDNGRVEFVEMPLGA